VLLRAAGRLLFCAVLLLAAALAFADEKHLAPGFSGLPKGSTLVIMPGEIELFSMGTDGTLEPKAEWTDTARRNFSAALRADPRTAAVPSTELPKAEAKPLADILALHEAVARSIAQYQFGSVSLATKAGKLDWSLGESVAPIRKLSGADYALFYGLRDSYATTGRKVLATAVTVLIGFDVVGAGRQTGYASLVDLKTGRVVWFNRLDRSKGDLREPEAAAETLGALLEEFPVVQ
jgi:hypothetical protein